MEISRIREIAPAVRMTAEFVLGFLGIIAGIEAMKVNPAVGIAAISIGLIGIIGSFIEAGSTARRSN